MKKIIALVLVCSVLMGIILYGTNYTYDFKVHLQSISEIGQDIPDLYAIVDIWNDDEFYPREHNMSYTYPYTEYNNSTGIIHVNAFMLVPENSDWGVFEVVKDILNSLMLVSFKVLYTVQFGAKYLAGLLEIVVKLSPMSGMVERTA